MLPGLEMQQERKRKQNMVNVNSVVYSPKKGRNDSMTNKLMAQIKALLENNKYLEATLARKKQETHKLEAKEKALLANNRHLARTLTKKIAEACKLETKGLLYENLKLESRLSIQAIQENIMIIETRLQNILTELTTWLSNFSLVQNFTKEAKEKIFLFLALIDSKSDAFSKQEIFPDSLKVSSKKSIKLLGTVEENVETPSSAYLKKRRNGISQEKEKIKTKINHNYNSFKSRKNSNCNIYEKNSEIFRSVGSVYDYTTLSSELTHSDDKHIKQKIAHLNEINESYQDPMNDLKTVSTWLEVQRTSRKLRPRKPINYSEKSQSQTAILHKTRRQCQMKEIKSETVTKIDKNRTTHNGTCLMSESKNCKPLHVSVKKEVLSQSEFPFSPPQRSCDAIALQNNISSIPVHSNTDLTYRNILTQYEKHHNFNEYIPTHLTRIEGDRHFKEPSNYEEHSHVPQTFTSDAIVEDISMNIKQEVVSPIKDNLENPNPPEETFSSETKNLLKYSAWLRDLG